MPTRRSLASSQKGGEPLLAKDPVCGMYINEQQAVAKHEYRGETFYFCSPGCLQEFARNPSRYADHRTPRTIQANERGPCTG
ncbi:MAG TPA: YHS domain-containing protein [Alphaproteobacteria bacterium]|nr:YHS domain-containing protein [Alphaproteobacteria bacterium]